MRSGRVALSIFAVWIVLVSSASAQEVPQSSSNVPLVTVPRLMRIAGTVRDAEGNVLTGTIGIKFALYKDASGQVPVWQETQNVQLNSAGHYSVLLGATTDEGLPVEIFSTGEARWLGTQPDGQAEQPRVLLLSVGYALKAADADMLGGRPASDFALAVNQDSMSPQSASAAVQSDSARLQIGAGTMPSLGVPATPCSSITSDGSGTVNQLSKFTSACNIENSAIFESGGNVGIGNTSPAGMLDVSGTAVIRGYLSALEGAAMAPIGAATPTQAFTSSPLDLKVSVYNTALVGPANYIYRWQAEPTGNNTTNTGATLNLQYGVTGDIAETGLSIAKNGVITFAPGQTFPSLGTVTSVATGAGLTGGPITKSGTISIPAGGVTNNLLANSSITVNAGSGLSGGGTVGLGGTVTITNAAPSLGGTVTSVAAGTGLMGGPITKSGTLSLNTSYTDTRYLQLNGGTLSGSLTGTTAVFSGAMSASNGVFAGPVNAAGVVMPSRGVATAQTGRNSNALDFLASSFNSSKSTAIAQDFRWQAEGVGNDSANPSATLNLLFASNGSAPVETGLSVASTGRLTFAPGQSFPGTGTITQITAGPGLVGGGSSGSVSLSLPKTCSAGQTLRWNGTNWICGSFGGVSGVADGIAYFLGPSNVTSTAAPTDGQILIGATGDAPSLGTLTPGANISITNGPGSIKISAAGAAALPYFVTGEQHAGSSVSAGANVTALWGFLLPYPVSTSKITYDVTTVDNSANKYNIGIYSYSGNLVVATGAIAGTTFAPSAAFHSVAWTKGAITLEPGRYYIAFTTNCTSKCAAIGATATYVSFAIAATGGASTGGALPATLTAPADNWAVGNQPTIVIH